MRISFLSIFVLFAIAGFGQNRTMKTLEERLRDTIANLPEVKQKMRYVQKTSERRLAVVVWEKPSAASPDYWLKLMEDNGSTSYTHYNFFIDKQSLSIRFFDPVRDSAISLSAWRKEQHQ